MKRAGKGRRGLRRRGAWEVSVAFTARKLQYHQGSGNLNSTPRFIPGAFLKRRVSFRLPTLDNSEKYALNVDQEKQTRHRSYFWHPSTRPVPSLCFHWNDWSWCLPQAGERSSETRSTSPTTWAPRRLNKAQKNPVFLRWHGLGIQDGKKSSSFSVPDLK